MSKHFVIDLDRTLFQTGRFTPQLYRWIEDQYHISKDELEGEQRDFYMYVDDLYAYDLFTHLKHHGIDTDDFSARVLASDFAHDSYLFDGASELLQECARQGEVSILSFGYDDYQRLKYQLCPTIAATAPLITTLVPKYKMIDSVATGNVTVIDDKPIGAQLGSGMLFIQALPEMTELPLQPWPVFHDLIQIRGYIKNLAE